jgi:serine/threonine-protein kinase
MNASPCRKVRRIGAAGKAAAADGRTLGRVFQEAAIGKLALLALIVAAFSVVLRLIQPRSIAPRVPVLAFSLGALVALLLLSHLVHRVSREVADAREIGSYRLIERISEGGMGEVWRAEHEMLARPAAIKLIRPEALAGNGRDVREVTTRFEREARATAALRSPHTVAVYDFGASEDGSLYYVMELLDGYDADTLVRRFGPLPPERVVHLIRQVCDSLEEAHRAGMVHRDIKPANILVCRYGLEFDFVKVVDFGLVRGSRGSTIGAERLTSPRLIAGTPEYLSPETAIGTADVDWRSDIYSLGCVAYWMLTAKPVFESSSPMKLAFDHAETPPAPPSRRTDREIPWELEQLVLECLAKDPRQRPQTARELSDRLAALSLGEPWTRRDAEIWWRDHPQDATAVAPAPDKPATDRLDDWIRREERDEPTRKVVRA